MTLTGNQPDEKKGAISEFNLTILSVAGQVGCLTLLIILASLVIGLGLDRLFQTSPIFTILLLVGSMPLTWIFVFFIVNRAKSRLTPPNTSKKPPAIREDFDSDKF